MKHKILWSFVGLFTVAGLATVIIPPFVNINELKQDIEKAIQKQTGDATKILGDINFSLIGGAQIVANNVQLENGSIERIKFNIPFSKLFDLSAISLTDDVTIYGANLKITNLIPPETNNVLNIKNSTFDFRGQKFELTDTELNDNILSGTIKTNNEDYYMVFDGSKFNIKNDDYNMILNGILNPDGSATGSLFLNTNKINDFFKFENPRIRNDISVSAKFYWDGAHGIQYTDIIGSDITGDVKTYNNNRRDINLIAENKVVDLSFLMTKPELIFTSNINIELFGQIKFGKDIFEYVKINTVGENDKIIIKEIIADDIKISGGIITKNEFENLSASFLLNNEQTFCLLSGNKTNWTCNDFKQGDISGTIIKADNSFNIKIKSNGKMIENTGFYKQFLQIANNGEIYFDFSDASGTVDIIDGRPYPIYNFIKHKNLNWLDLDLYFLSDKMKTEIGDLKSDKDTIYFTAKASSWKFKFSPKNNEFKISGLSIKQLLPTDINLSAFNDKSFIISGKVYGANIYDLNIQIGDHIFKGNAVKNNIQLSGDVLNIDNLLSKNYIENYDEFQFLNQASFLIPFDFGLNISLSANKLIYNGETFSNFLYSLNDNEQSFSIDDEYAGDLLTTITDNKTDYDILIELNNFVTRNKLLNDQSPINIENTTITGQAKLNTSGKIAADIWYNLKGNMDIVFNGGNLIGLGIDKFYQEYEYINRMNAEYAIATALETGTTKLKYLRLIGEYNNGDFISTKPFELSMNNSQANGILKIIDGVIDLDLSIILRGISMTESPINLNIENNKNRKYSLSEIMVIFDPYYFKDFVAKHNKF